MKNEAGDKSPIEAALSVLIEGEALTLVPLRSICRGGYHPPERRKKEERRMVVARLRLAFKSGKGRALPQFLISLF